MGGTVCCVESKRVVLISYPDSLDIRVEVRLSISKENLSKMSFLVTIDLKYYFR